MSTAVGFQALTAVVEAPSSGARTNAVFAELEKPIPNKPIRYLVVTHHHFDHSGGIRTYAAEGATVITDDHNKDYFQKVVLGPQSRAIEPDRLSPSAFSPPGPCPLTLETFPDPYPINSGQPGVIPAHVDNLN